MKLIEIYQCLCEETRLRILNLLIHGPLCVCHLQKIVSESQVNISRHLAYLKKRGVVEVRRHAHWMIYSLPTKRPIELEANLKCLQDCATTDAVFKKDLQKLKVILSSSEVKEVLDSACCPSPARNSKKQILISK